MTAYLHPRPNQAASNPYFFAKQLDLLDHGVARSWLGKTTHQDAELHGLWVSRELYHLDHGCVGYERIFFNVTNKQENGFPKRPSFKRDYEGDQTPVFTPINVPFNELPSANTFIIVGGFADGVTVSNAVADPNVAVLAIQGEQNTPRLVEQLRERFPNTRIIAALDGDHTGRKAAIRSNCDWVTPENGDWNELYIDQGLGAVSERLKRVDPPLPDFNVWELKRPDLTYIPKPMVYFSTLTDPKEIAACAMALCLRNTHKIPVMYQREREFLEYLLTYNYRLSAGTRALLVDVMYQATRRQKQIAVNLISLPKPHETKHIHTKVKSLADIGPLVRDGVYLVSAGHGSGKTKHIGIPFIAHARGKSMAICHLSSLTADIAERFDIPNYQEYKQSLRDVVAYGGLSIEQATATDNRNSVAICLNSLIGTLESWTNQCGTLLLDEASAGLMALATGSHIDEASRKAIFDRLVSVIRKARRVLFMDADLDLVTIKFLEFCRPDEEFNIYEMPRQRTDFNVEWAYGAHAQDVGIQHIFALLADNKHVIVPSDSHQKAISVTKLVETTFPDKKILLICQSTRENQAVKDFLRDSNKYAPLYDCVIHSPSLRSGVSIEVDHFDSSVALFSGASITPSDAIQMLRRVRTLKEWLICVSGSKTYEIDDAQTLATAQQLASGGADQVTDFDSFVNELRAKEARGKNHFAENLYRQLVAYRFNIKHHTDSEEFERGVLGSAIKADREYYRSAVCNAPHLTQYEYEQLSRDNSKTQEDMAAVEAYQIRELFGIQSIEEEHIKLWDEGRILGKLKELKALLSGGDIDDLTEGLSLSQRAFTNVRLRSFRNILALTNITLADGATAGDISVEQEQAILEHCWNNRVLYGYLNIIPAQYARPKARKPKDAKKLIRPMFEKVGIGLESHKTSSRIEGRIVNHRYLRINTKQMKLMAGLAGRINPECRADPELLLKKNTQSALHLDGLKSTIPTRTDWVPIPAEPLPDREVALPSALRPNLWGATHDVYVPNYYAQRWRNEIIITA